MLGIFDSGRGAEAVLSRVRALYPTSDICVLEDRENAPYGTKSREELLPIVKSNIGKLITAGASRVLIGCCTASTVYGELGRIEKQISIPIIAPTASLAATATKNGKIGVIATEATVRSGVFTREIRKLSRTVTVYERAAQKLVGLVEGLKADGVTDGDKALVAEVLSDFHCTDIDTLVLGCTHFPHLSKVIKELLPDVKLVSCAEAAALWLSPLPQSTGKTVFL